MPITYEISRLPDGKYKYLRVSSLGKASTALSFSRSELEISLRTSVSTPRLEDALRILDTTGRVTVEADLEVDLET
jgi:hypothetical protein